MNRSSMIFLLLLFSAAIFFSSPWLSGDGRKYFFLARSVVIDRDINLYNEFGYFFQGVQGAPRWGRELDSGYSLILHPVGASLFFIPFLFVGHLLSQFLKILGIPIIANGFSYPETALF
ncbi:MAG: hypothetical protein FJ088_16480, partial [Deltaproteobacteria bacterium]|nr:hypothetical protein [Deltaproteobacteria bacterium]